jgi:hypothetical protein
VIVRRNGVEWIPTDEGEAEAQPPLPPITVTLGPSPEDGSEWPRTLTFECPSVRGRTAEIDSLLAEQGAEHLRRQGYWTDGDPVVTWAHGPEGRVRRAEHTVVGFGDPTPGGAP